MWPRRRALRAVVHVALLTTLAVQLVLWLRLHYPAGSAAARTGVMKRDVSARFTTGITALPPRQSLAGLAEYTQWRAQFALDRQVTLVRRPEDVGECDAVQNKVVVNITSATRFAHGTVKDVYLGRWGPTGHGVAVLKLRSDKYNGDFSSGMARLRGLQGHTTIWPLLAVCPHWDRYVSGDSDAFRSTRQEYEAQGYGPGVFNTAVTALSNNGPLDRLDKVLVSEAPYADTWRTRLDVAIDFVRCMAYLHNSPLERNPLNATLVQKDYKIGQFLLDDNLVVKLNDAEAMPATVDPDDIARDLAHIVPTIRFILGSNRPRPGWLDEAVDRLEPVVDPAHVLLTLISLVHLN